MSASASCNTDCSWEICHISANPEAFYASSESSSESDSGKPFLRTTCLANAVADVLLWITPSQAAAPAPAPAVAVIQGNELDKA